MFLIMIIVFSLGSTTMYGRRYSSRSRSRSYSSHSSSFSRNKKSIFSSSLSNKRTTAKKKTSIFGKKSYSSYKKKQSPKSSAKSTSHKNYSYKSNTHKNYYYTHVNYNPPRYYYSHSRSFGLWDSLFLWMMIDKITNPHYQRFYYNHQNDPDVMRFKEQAEEEAKNNEELQGKLDIMNQKIDELKEDNVQIDKSYLPEGISKDVALSNTLLDEDKESKERERENNKNLNNAVPEVKKQGTSPFVKIGIIIIVILLGLNLIKRR